MAGAGSDASGGARLPVVVTGADGFVGRAVVDHWRASGRPLRAVQRREPDRAASTGAVQRIADLAAASAAELDALLAGAAAVLHLAGRAHVMAETAADPAACYRHANVEATVRLAQAAARAGVGRFVLASSIKVNGECSAPGRPFTAAAAAAPADGYARSKRDAETALQAALAGTSTAPIILRLPLVYGPGAKANFLALFAAVARGRRLPLGAVRARRTLLYTGNLVAAFEAALDGAAPPAGVFLLGDEPAVEVRELVRAIAVALALPNRSVAVPEALLRLGGWLTGRGAAVGRLTRPLEADSEPFRLATGYRQVHSLAEGLAATARWWRESHAQ
jgi:UDP-glucose 4-epimerase